MLTILVDKITPRIKYTFDFIFTERSIPYCLVTGVSDFEEIKGTRFNYSISNGAVIPDLLYREDLVHPMLAKRSDRLWIDDKDDLVAAVFFILTRFEEYTDSRDEYGRYPFEQSILGKDWIELAVCDRWSIQLIKALSLPVNDTVRLANIQPTFDIDNTYAYKLKGGRRKAISIFKDLLTANTKRIKERKAVLSGTIKDPYDTFDLIQSIAEKHVSTRVFWLVGKWAKKDRNIGIRIPEHREHIKGMSSSISIGLHPSFASFNRKDVIQREKRSLEEVTGQGITESRQHFLRFRLPTSYQQLMEAGFENEYSMGFAENVGFRAGTARVHNWFDLSQNKEMSLRIHPFVYMDGTLREYMKLDVNESKARIEKLYKEVSNYGGDFTFIWHNETIGDYGLWKGWKEVLTHTLNLR